MNAAKLLLTLAVICGLCACGRGLEFDIANNDSAAFADAIRAANAAPSHSKIRLARRGLYVLSSEAEAGLLLPGVTGRLTIEGNHAEVRGYSTRPAAILETTEEARLIVENLVLAEGTNGTLRNFGWLRLTNVAIVDGSVTTGTAIVLNHGELETVGGEIAFNHLLSNRRDAGTVLNFGRAKFTDTRIHGNRAISRHPAVAVSGGVLNFGQVAVESVLFDDNEIPAEDSPRLSFGGILNVGNGRVSGKTSPDQVRNARLELVASE
jgi:hypothetical protein